PSKEYLRISQEPSHISCEPRKQLLILDLNGTLISRLKGNGRGYYVRPHYKQFLEFVFNHFTVMVWSSARQQSVQMMCKIFQQPLELVWNRDHFELEPDQYYRNTETVKDLTKAWHHFSNRHDAKDTIMLDDTISKLIYQPYNLIHIKTFDSNDIIKGAADNELLKVIRYLDVLRSQSNVANFMRNDPF
ncbi:HAD-like domain-containing protein, partial [Parasitella parasitica]